MFLKRIISLTIISSLIFTQTTLFASEVKYTFEYAIVKGDIETTYNKSSSDNLNYTTILNNLTDKLFSLNDTQGDGVLLTIVNNDVKKHIDEMKKTDFVLKGTDNLVSQKDSAFGKTFELDYNDDDGIYVGFIENHLSSLSRGYYIKKYTKFDKKDGIQKEYVYLGKANFVNDMSQNLIDYMKNNKVDNVQPFLLSYYNYLSTYNNFLAPGKGAPDNSDGIYKENSVGWNGLINLNQTKNTKESIEIKFENLILPYNSIEGQSLSLLTNESNKLFLENGKVFQYKPANGTEEISTHLSLANTFMANNNLKRGFLLKPSNPYNNFKFQSHNRCIKKVLKSCVKREYWQTVTYSDGMDIYSTNFLDENFMDDWTSIPYQNADFTTGSVVVPTMIPVNSYAKLPSLNSENYGYLYLSNYSGSLGGKGKYDYSLFPISGVYGGTKTLESSRIAKSSWAKFISVVVAATFGIVAGVALYEFIRKSVDYDAFNNKINQNLSNINLVSNNIITQYSNQDEIDEMLNSPVLFGLMSNFNNYDMNKNFLSNTYHSKAITYAKNNINGINANNYFKSIPIIANMNSASTFWKQKHKEIIIERYRDDFYNDGKSGGNFYSMKIIFRDIVKQYMGY